jgi:UDP-N-acetylmuramate--alanine ligase
METYGNNFETLRQAFLKFIENLPFYGLAVLCIDDPVICRSLAEISRPMRTYGFDPAADISIIEDSCHYDGWMSHFTVKRRNASELAVTLKLPGRHNILNAAAAIAIAQELNISDEALLKALSNFSGVGRRLQHHGSWTSSRGKTAYVLDDYGHHPTEIQVTLNALKQAYPNRRIVMIFQPHRYTRTRDLFEDFAIRLSECDELCLLEVYSAGEPLIPGADSQHLALSIRQRGKIEPILITQTQQLSQILSEIVQENDLVLFQGAGNIGGLAGKLVEGGL